MATHLDPLIATTLRHGLVIPACPLALTAQRRFDVRRQRALVRYYVAAGAGGLAVGVHMTQFSIRDSRHGLLQPLLRLVAAELDRLAAPGIPLVRIAGVCGPSTAAVAEAQFARDCGYHAGLLSLAAPGSATEDALLAYCRAVAEVLPLVGFYLQPAVGGRVLPVSFWRRFVEIDNVIAIKIAPFNRYQTLDVVRAVIEGGRDDIALYTGNDDNILIDLLTPFCFEHHGMLVERRIVGGLLGQWAVWTRQAVALLDECHRLVSRHDAIPVELLRRHVELTDANAALFDAANNFTGCIAGIHEALRRQGLLDGIWCLDPSETLSARQTDEIDRVWRAYPHLRDDDFVRDNLDRWLDND
jgi:dihydrodipicolinate synthase/N-acetylneuraminate lyase